MATALTWCLALGVLAASAEANGWPRSFGALLARSSRHHGGRSGNLTVETEVIERALEGTSADDSMDAIDAIEELSMMNKPPGLMDQINQMRCEVCWKRDDVLGHKKCVKFFTKVCKKHHRGDSEVCKVRCPKFLELLQKECWSPNPKHPPAQQWCDLYEEITGIKCPKPAPEPKPDDKDGDGHKDAEDAFPDDPNEWADEDGDGIGDNADPDRDGDGHNNDVDAFPDDPKEWADEDGDGIGDNADPDRDGDGHNNDVDAFPKDKTEWLDSDFDGVGNNADPDRDGDGHNNDKDAFPDDKAEWKDSDGDGIGDNADEDRDGDGHNNDADKYPDDPTKWEDPTTPPPAAPPAAAPAPGPAGDRDADGCPDGTDAFPDDPSECLDSDGDGFGDNRDPWPHNPNCYHPGEPCPEAAEKTEPTDAQQQMIDPSTLNKIEQGLPSQGYDEHSEGLVEHDDASSSTEDWGKEWPSWNRESEHQSIKRICEEYPEYTFCKSKFRMKEFKR